MDRPSGKTPQKIAVRREFDLCRSGFAMDAFKSFSLISVLMVPACFLDQAIAEPPRIDFDMPSTVTAVDTTPAGGRREITLEFALSSLVVAPSEAGPRTDPPIDHMLVYCRCRDSLPVVDYSPKTSLASDFAGTVSVTRKTEQVDSFGLSVNGKAQYVAGGHVGVDDQDKRSDSTQYQRHAPLAAVVASGTTHRGRGVYFKFRWTSRQVLEGEKRFRVTVAVPEAWRGGLVDVRVDANGKEGSLFATPKMRTILSKDFVIAAHQEHDAEAADLAIRLARLDQRLATFAGQDSRHSNPITPLVEPSVGPYSRGTPVRQLVSKSDF